MRRDELSQKIKENLNCAKEALLELPNTLREIGGERFSQVTLITLATCGLIISFCLGQITYKSKLKHAKANYVAVNGINIPGRYLGKFSISHYCSCPICTGTAKGSRTATGHIPREGRTVAVDKHIIPLHSVIYVEGLGTFVAEDVGGAVKGNHLDIYIDDHQRALNLGTLKGAKPNVYILE